MLPILMTEIRGRDVKRHGTVYPGEVLKDTTVEIEPGKSITIMTVLEAGTRYVPCENVVDMKTGRPRYVANEECLVTKTYKIGDTAKVGSYNLTYMGTVRKITSKTVTVVEHEDSPGCRKTYRFSIYDFAVKNATFDAEHEAERNAEMMMTI